MSTTISSIPKSAEEFDEQLKKLLPSLAGDPDKLTNQEIAQRLYDASDDKADPVTGFNKSDAEAVFHTIRKLTVTRKHHAEPSFDGNSVIQWLGRSQGSMASSDTGRVQFAAYDAVTIGSRVFLVIFFYKMIRGQWVKVAVYVGTPIPFFNSGEGELFD